MSVSRMAWLLALCCLLGGQVAVLSAWARDDRLPAPLHQVGDGLPAGFSLARVMTDARLAAQRAEVSEVRASFPPQVAVDRVASFWRLSLEGKVLEHRAGDWWIVSRLTRGRIEVLQIRAGESTAFGFLTVWRAGTEGAGTPLERLVPERFRSGPILQVREGPSVVTSVVVQGDDPQTVGASRLIRRLEQHGFRAVAQLQPTDPAGAEWLTVTRLRRGAQELTLLPAPTTSGSSVFVITHSEPSP